MPYFHVCRTYLYNLSTSDLSLLAKYPWRKDKGEGQACLDTNPVVHGGDCNTYVVSAFVILHNQTVVCANIGVQAYCKDLVYNGAGWVCLI